MTDLIQNEQGGRECKKTKYEEMQNELRRLRKIEKTNKENLIAWSDESREYAEYKETVIEGLERLLTHIQKGSLNERGGVRSNKLLIKDYCIVIKNKEEPWIWENNNPFEFNKTKCPRGEMNTERSVEGEKES